MKTDDDIIQFVNRFISDDETEHVEALDEEDKAVLQYLAGRRRPESSLPFVGASNLDIGGMVTMSHVDSIHARMMFAAEKSQPLVTFTGENPDDVAQATRYINQKLEDDVDIIGLLDDWGLESLIGGCRRAKACWEEESQRVSKTWKIRIPPELADLALTNEHVTVLLINRLSRQFKDFTVVEDRERVWTVTFERDGKKQTAKVEWEEVGDKIHATVTYVEIVFKGVRTYVINPEDFRKSVGPLQTCQIIAHRVWLRWSQIVQRVKAGTYKGIDISPESNFAVYAKRRQDAYYNQPSNAEAIRNKAAGVDPQATPEKEFEFLECYILHDWKGDGILEDRIITISPDAKQVVRNKSRTGEGMTYRPFSEIIIGKIPGKPNYGFGIPKMIRDSTREETAIHNLTMDSSMLQAIASLFYNGTTPLKPEQRKLSVGRINQFPDNGTGKMNEAFYKPDFSANLQPLFVLYDRLQTMTQAIDGVGETQLLQRPTPRTLGQSAMVQNELNIRFQRIFGRGVGSKAKASMTGLAGLIEIIVDLYRNYGDPIEVIAETGKQSNVAFPQSSSLSLRLNIDVNKLNQEQEMKNAQMVSANASNPLKIQLGISNAETVYKADRDLYLAMGVRNPDDYLVKPDPSRSSPMDAKRENVLMMRGVVLMPHPGDNDMEHYVSHKQFEADLRERPELANAEAFAAIEQHNTAHLRQAQAKQQASALQSQMTQAGAMPPQGASGVPVAGGGPMPGQGGPPAGNGNGMGAPMGVMPNG